MSWQVLCGQYSLYAWLLWVWTCWSIHIVYEPKMKTLFNTKIVSFWATVVVICWCFGSLISTKSITANESSTEGTRTWAAQHLCNLFYSNNESYNHQCLIVLVAFHLFMLSVWRLRLPHGWTLWITREISKEAKAPPSITRNHVTPQQRWRIVTWQWKILQPLIAADSISVGAPLIFLWWGDNKSPHPH